MGKGGFHKKEPICQEEYIRGKIKIPEKRVAALLGELVTVEGATSSKQDCDSHDIPWAAVRMIGERLFYGRKRHGRFNWKRGEAGFAEERIKHLVTHTMLFAEHRRLEDLQALLCNAAMLAWYWDNGKVSTNPTKQFMEEGKETR